MPRKKNVVTVQIECAALAWATRDIRTEQEWADWGRSFVEALSTNKHGINHFADSLMANVHEYRDEKAEQMRIFRENKGFVANVTEHLDVTEHSTTSSLVLSSLDKEKEEFKNALKAYPTGKKRGLEVEWADFLKKHKKQVKEITPLLLPAVHGYVAEIKRLQTAPNYIKWFQGWITESRWTIDYANAELPPTGSNFLKKLG